MKYFSEICYGNINRINTCMQSKSGHYDSRRNVSILTKNLLMGSTLDGRVDTIQKCLKQTIRVKYYVHIRLYQSFQTQLFCIKNRPMVEIPKEKSGTVNFAGIACMSMSANRFESTKSSLTSKKFFSISARIICFSHILEYFISKQQIIQSGHLLTKYIFQRWVESFAFFFNSVRVQYPLN